MDVGALRSTVQFMRLASVPELVACEADGGTRICSALWLLMWMLVAEENEGRRVPPLVSSMPSLTIAVPF